MGTNVAPVVGNLLFSLCNLIALLGVVGGGIVVLVAAWRGVKALESIADSLRRIANQPS